MQNENKPGNQNSKPARRKPRPITPLTLEELQLLKAKRFIEFYDVQRFFLYSVSTMYNRIRSGDLIPTSHGGRHNMFDLELIYANLAAGNGKKRKKK